jgi:hypothetical protein
MALARDVARWPLLLCGPILRRVTRASAAVFVATSKKCSVSFDIYSGTGTSSKGTFVSRTIRDTRKIGDRLHVAVVQSSGLPLVPGRVYGYDLALTPENGAAQGLTDLGLLAAPLSLAYDFTLPTFSVPADPSELVITYGSCRKAHGPGPDALPLVDRMIERDHATASKRPHHLILGGDQIYADDVPIALLAMIREVVPNLLGPGYAETLTPLAGPAFTFAAPTSGPGRVRAQFVNRSRSVGFTAGLDDENLTEAHLLFLGEFLAMYLFQWSDALWPTTTPRAEEVLAVITDPPDGYEGRIDSQLPNLEAFRRSMPLVRRVLANVPTLMIFDDHDVTDDWNLHRAWDARVRTVPATAQVVRNALTAYTIFQDWGNDPSKYSGGALPYPISLRVLQAIASDPGPPNPPPADLDLAFDLTTTRPARDERMRWDWDLTETAAGYRIIALDTRTWRGFPPPPASAVSHAALIASDPMLTDTQLLIAGRPLGFQLLERGVAANLLTLIVSSAPVLGNPFVELLLGDPINFTEHAAASIDAESWAGNRPAFEDLLRRLANLGRVVLLSGDVHYGFCIEASWFETPAVGAPRGARIVQCCSSAFKNESEGTAFLGRNGRGNGVDELPALGWFGFATDRRASRNALRGNLAVLRVPPAARFAAHELLERFDAPCVLPDRHYSTSGLTEIQRLIGMTPGSNERTDWRYLLRYLADVRTDAQRLADAGLDPGLLASNPHLRELLLFNAVVGVNNVGRITFTVTNNAPSALTHELHWWLTTPGGVAVAPMKTVHQASLLPPDPTADFPVPLP